MIVKGELQEILHEINKTIEDITAIRLVLKSTVLICDVELNEESLDLLDKEYDDGYGSQELYGTVLFIDSTWLARTEYDGSERWEYFKSPTVEQILNNKDNLQ